MSGSEEENASSQQDEDLAYGGVCPVCGDEFTDGFDKLEEGESREDVRVCVVDLEDGEAEALFHLPEAQQHPDGVFDQLEPDTRDYIVNYARTDETPAETLQRLVLAAVPHSNEVKQIGIEPGNFDDDSQFIYERWPDTDGYVDSRIYGGIEEFIHGHEPAIQFIGGDD